MQPGPCWLRCPCAAWCVQGARAEATVSKARWRTPMFLSLCLCFSAPLPAQQVQELLWEKLGAALEQLQRGWGHQF